MNTIETHLKTVLKEDSKWIKFMTAYPNTCKNINQTEFNYFKAITSYKECKSERTYLIIKKLISLQGIRSIHPSWFFIHKKRFEEDKFIFEEDIIDEYHTLNLVIPKDFHIPHQIQIKATLSIYYTFLKNPKIREMLVDQDSEFVNTYPEFNEIWKYLLFPIVEKKLKGRHIDLSYDFDNIMESINIEINEPHHKECKDIKRETEFYYNTGDRIIQYYVNKDSITSIIDKLFFRMTVSIFNENKYAGLVFNAFIHDIIENLFIAIFFSFLKEKSLNKELTWELFVKKCEEADIEIDNNYIKIFENEIKHIEDEIERKEKYNKMFYNYVELNDNTLLKETGYDYYLMQLQPDQSQNSFEIKEMYSRYRQEYERMMTMLLSNKDEEKVMLRDYTQRHIQHLNNTITRFKQFGKNFMKQIKRKA